MVSLPRNCWLVVGATAAAAGVRTGPRLWLFAVWAWPGIEHTAEPPQARAPALCRSTRETAHVLVERNKTPGFLPQQAPALSSVARVECAHVGQGCTSVCRGAAVGTLLPSWLNSGTFLSPCQPSRPAPLLLHLGLGGWEPTAPLPAWPSLWLGALATKCLWPRCLT